MTVKMSTISAPNVVLNLVALNARHYANMPMQYVATFKGCKKNDNFQVIFLIIFLTFAQRYTLEPPQ